SVAREIAKQATCNIKPVIENSAPNDHNATYIAAGTIVGTLLACVITTAAKVYYDNKKARRERNIDQLDLEMNRLEEEISLLRNDIPSRYR
ncbi:MAG: hypothetical protein ACK4M7_07935, partial [Burkholderiales bacterium]